MTDQLKEYYENYDEDARLFRDKAHLPEYLTTIRYFDRLFQTGSHILDACAGTGRYSFHLADKGHIVTAGDLVEHNVNLIKSNPKADRLAKIAVCDVLDLTQYKENSFDVVLCMGALYHLESDELKEKAIAECVRICKPNGMVVLAYINKVGAVFRYINEDMSNIDEAVKRFDNSHDSLFFFTTPQKIEIITKKLGLTKIYNIATDGMIYAVGDKLNQASEEDFQKYMEYHYSTCEDESTIGASLHGLWIGRK